MACAVVVVTFALTRGGGAAVWKQGFLAGIAMAMAILPEEFPVVLTIFLALGAWRLSRSRVLTRTNARRRDAGRRDGAVRRQDRHAHAEPDDAAKARHTLATTGDLATLSGQLPEELHDLLEYAILASKRDPFDPMERALHEAGDRLGQEHGASASRAGLWCASTRSRPALLAVSHAWRSGSEAERRGRQQGSAGGHRRPVPSRSGTARRDGWRGDCASPAQGLRVLGVARG